jgi:hypothetical protein
MTVIVISEGCPSCSEPQSPSEGAVLCGECSRVAKRLTVVLDVSDEEARRLLPIYFEALRDARARHLAATA